MLLFAPASFAIATIWAEARGEPFEGKVGVAEVLLNRTGLKFQSDGTLVGTVLHPYAFSSFNTTDPNRRPLFGLDDSDPIVSECQRAWALAKTGTNYTLGADTYWNPDTASPKWAKFAKLTVKIGKHQFAVLRGGGR